MADPRVDVSVMPVERRASLPIRVAALAGFLVLSAGLIVAYSASLNAFSETISMPYETVLKYIHWVPLWSVGLYTVLLLWGVKNHRAALLFSLSLPAAVALPVLIFGSFAVNDGNPLGLQIVFYVVYPATWLLPIIAIFQTVQLGIPRRDIGRSGYVFAIFIVGLYLWTAIVNDAMISTEIVQP